MKKFFSKIGAFFCAIGRGIKNGFVWCFKNKLVVMQILREAIVTIAPLVLLASFPLHYVLKYLAKDSMIALNIALGGCLLYGVYFILSAVYYLLKALDNKRLAAVEKEMADKKEAAVQKYEEEKRERKGLAAEKETVEVKAPNAKDQKQESTPKQESKFVAFFKKIHNFLTYNENSIKIVTSGLCGLLSVGFFCTIFFEIEYWDVYYFYTILLWAIFAYSVVELILSKNLKTAISMAIVDIALLVLMIIVTPKAHSMYYDLAAYTNTNEYDIYMLIITFITMLPLRVGMANGYLEKVKRTRNFGFGLLCLVAGVAMYLTPGITKVLNDSYIGVGVTERLVNQMIPYRVMGIVFVFTLAISAVNVAVNLSHYIKKRNYLGIFDLMCSVVGVILGCYAMHVMANYLIMFGR